MSTFAARHPVLFSAIAVLVSVAGIKLLDAALASLAFSTLADRLIVETTFCGFVVLLVAALGWWREAGFTTPVAGRRLFAYLPLALLPLAVTATNGFRAASAERVAGFAALTMMVGFAEEGLMRGVVLRALLPTGAFRAALLSSVLFGLGHLLNIAQGASPETTAVQIVYATLLGVGFAGARLYAGTIWPAIAIHALQDFADIASRGFVLPPPQSITLARALVPIVITGIYALYGAWLIKRAAIRAV